ncbi:unnamed protein product [Calypogeia fissa]
MIPQVISVRASVKPPTNVVVVEAFSSSSSSKSSFRVAEGWSRNLSSSSATMSTATPLKNIISRRPLRNHDQQQGKSSTINCVSVSDELTSTSVSDDLPLKEIPGTYGLPFFGAVMDRLDFMWFQKLPNFYNARKDKYNSTVFRTNVPPGPPFFPDPRVVVVLDEKSYPILFDVSKVWKKDIFVGTYMPSLALTGGYKTLSYLDPSEEKHTLLKNFAFHIIKSSSPRLIQEIAAAVTDMFSPLDASIKKDGKAAYGTSLQTGTFKMVLKAYTGQDPYAQGKDTLGEGISNQVLIWLGSQIAPITPVPVPWFLAPLVEIFLHTFRIPAFISKGTYDKLLAFFGEYGTELLDFAEKEIGLDREEAKHNLLFLTCFNSWGGIHIFFPDLVKRLGTTSVEYQKELAAEVRKAVADNGGKLTPKALGDMPLVESVVYEVLRIDPPVPFQYAKAKEDLVIQSHDASFQIKKGETIHGYMPVATHDPKVFVDAESFLPKRFVGEEGKALLKYVLWSNGPQTEEPSVENKHCAGKDFVLLASNLFVASIYLQYDSFQVDSTGSSLTSLKKST